MPLYALKMNVLVFFVSMRQLYYVGLMVSSALDFVLGSQYVVAIALDCFDRCSFVFSVRKIMMHNSAIAPIYF